MKSAKMTIVQSALKDDLVLEASFQDGTMNPVSHPLCHAVFDVC
jgi:energy-converting hydrogenase Eha subunit H